MPAQIVPLILYSDDASGNRSKKFNLLAFQLAGLPKHENAHIHFIGASNRVTAMDMSVEIAKDLRMLEERKVMVDAHIKEEVLILAPVICFICDDVRASELLNHMGSTANKYCRICHARQCINRLHSNFYLL